MGLHEMYRFASLWLALVPNLKSATPTPLSISV